MKMESVPGLFLDGDPRMVDHARKSWCPTVSYLQVLDVADGTCAHVLDVLSKNGAERDCRWNRGGTERTARAGCRLDEHDAEQEHPLLVREAWLHPSNFFANIMRPFAQHFVKADLVQFDLDSFDPMLLLLLLDTPVVDHDAMSSEFGKILRPRVVNVEYREQPAPPPFQYAFVGPPVGSTRWQDPWGGATFSFLRAELEKRGYTLAKMDGLDLLFVYDKDDIFRERLLGRTKGGNEERGEATFGEEDRKITKTDRSATSSEEGVTATGEGAAAPSASSSLSRSIWRSSSGFGDPMRPFETVFPCYFFSLSLEFGFAPGRMLAYFRFGSIVEEANRRVQSANIPVSAKGGFGLKHRLAHLRSGGNYRYLLRENVAGVSPLMRWYERWFEWWVRGYGGPGSSSGEEWSAYNDVWGNLTSKAFGRPQVPLPFRLAV